MTDRSIVYPRVDQMIWDARVFKLKPGVVEELKTNMKEIGQLQPIVIIRSEGEGKPSKLNIGRHRYQAVKELYKENPSYVHMFLGKPCPPMTIPAIDVFDIPAEILLNMEISENVHRMDLSWQEKTMALAQLHRAEQERFEQKKIDGIVPTGASYTISATAAKLAGATGGNVDAIRSKISQALVVADRMEDPEIAKAESTKAAFNIVRHKLTVEARKLAADYDGDTPHELIVGDCAEIMSNMNDEDDPNRYETPDQGFKLILADPPYGIGADTYDNMRHHKYDDSWENAEDTYRNICVEGLDLCRDGSSMFLFCTPERWHHVRDLAREAGWNTWFRPIIWFKSNEGMRPHGQQGFAYAYECIMYAWKGNPSRASLIQSHIDVFQIYKVPPSEREHAAAKPIGLYQKLMEMTCLPGDYVLDPCVGSGTSFKAGYLQKLRVVGIEKIVETAEIARKNLFWTGQETIKADDPTALDIDQL